MWYINPNGSIDIGNKNIEYFAEILSNDIITKRRKIDNDRSVW